MRSHSSSADGVVGIAEVFGILRVTGPQDQSDACIRARDRRTRPEPLELTISNCSCYSPLPCVFLPYAFAFLFLSPVVPLLARPKVLLLSGSVRIRRKRRLRATRSSLLRAGH